MTREEILAYQQRMTDIRATPLGNAFFRFKYACERALISDTEDSLTDKDRISTKRHHEEYQAREREFLALLEPVIFGDSNGQQQRPDSNPREPESQGQEARAKGT